MIFPVTSPPAIVWTQGAPSYEIPASNEVSADMPALKIWNDREHDLSTIGRYGKNWDGFGAAAPDPLVVGRAVAFLRFLRDLDRTNPPVRVSLSPDGLIALEWLDTNKLVRAEIGDSAEIEWMVATPGQPTEFETKLFGDPLESAASRGQEWRPAEAAAGALVFAYGR